MCEPLSGMVGASSFDPSWFTSALRVEWRPARSLIRSVPRLENKVIDIEVAHQTPSPTIDPSVHTILIGHSMGGIVAAETLLMLANEQPLPPTTSSLSSPDVPNFPSNTTQHSTTSTSRPNPSSADPNRDPLSPTSFMFPHIQGLLAFDTPFLGIAPSVIAHGAEGYSKKATNAYSALSELATGLGWGSKSEPKVASSSSGKVAGALPAPSSAADAAAAPRWQSWGKYAMFAGAAGAVAAGGAAALYSQKEKLSTGWTWAYSHLEFVGVLYKGEELKKRVESVGSIGEERGIGSANFYTLLGKSANEGFGVVEATSTRKEGNSMRTFCSLPRKVRESKGEAQQEATGLRWFKALNDKAEDETWAHMSMFYPRDNPGFYSLGERAKKVVTGWIDRGWYGSSEDRKDGTDGGITLGEVGEGWEKPDRESEDVKAKERQKSVSFDWEGLDGVKDLDDDDDVKMRDEPGDQLDENKGNLGDSIIVDIEQKAPLSS
jgi:pimeloyl-ACP methyl ester carboxylesterase